MVFRLIMSAKKKWRKISGPNRLPEVILGVEFKDGIKQGKIRLMRAVTNFRAYLHFGWARFKKSGATNEGPYGKRGHWPCYGAGQRKFGTPV
jgi:hypothetical protein